MNIQIKPSKILRYYFLVIHFAAAAVVFSLPVGLEYRGLLILLLIMSISYYLLPKGYGNKNTPVKLQRIDEALWDIEYLDGHQQRELQLVSSMVTLHFIVMNFKHPHKYQYTRLLLLSDMVEKNLMRQLRVELRHNSLG